MINTAFLTDSPLFRNLDETERALILIIGQVRAFEAGQAIFREGDAGDGLYIVVKGSVRISKQSA
ncbi:MAG TPA: cyclic nucleotide-binding domain-containing protein, partial [Holophaga sp.]|nr:cyclic nucleotide-binding domain-containing protein [Holophaga sp.]